MSRPQTEKMQAALAAVRAGSTAYAAAKAHGISLSGMYKACRRHGIALGHDQRAEDEANYNAMIGDSLKRA